jgi:hypothetical protein
MNWLSRLRGKSKANGRPSPTAMPDPGAQGRLAPTPTVETPVSAPEPAPEPVREPEAPPSLASQIAPVSERAAPIEPAQAEGGWETEADEPEEVEDVGEHDPTIGRYEPLDERPLDDADLKALRAEAERAALSGPHKVGPADSAGPGTVVEALMRLEGEGRVVSRVCDDAESGFYILYNPAPDQR